MLSLTNKIGNILKGPHALGKDATKEYVLLLLIRIDEKIKITSSVCMFCIKKIVFTLTLDYLSIYGASNCCLKTEFKLKGDQWLLIKFCYSHFDHEVWIFLRCNPILLWKQPCS